MMQENKEKKEKIKIVCVANNLDTYNQVIATNKNMNIFDTTLFDNSKENIGISKRYNSFINEQINADSDFWVIFCHQDFGFNEDPLKKLEKLDKNSIYGAVGVSINFDLNIATERFLFKKLGFLPSLKFFKNGKLFSIEKKELHLNSYRKKLYGRIKQGIANSRFRKIGRFVFQPKTVSVLDCCCMIVHSSLINKCNLQFDEKLDWHMYIEDFCLGAKNNHNISTKVIQFDCYHLGEGTLNEDFYKSFDYVQNKYSLDYLKTTCYEK